MIDVVFYFQVHQPYRLKRLSPSEADAAAGGVDIWDTELNRLVVERVAERCYLPMNRVLLDAIERTDGEFRCSFSLSGTVIRQLREWAPAALDSFVALAETECVEFLCETSRHGLPSLACPEEFAAQVEQQRAAGLEPEPVPPQRPLRATPPLQFPHFRRGDRQSVLCSSSARRRTQGVQLR